MLFLELAHSKFHSIGVAHLTTRPRLDEGQMWTRHLRISAGRLSAKTSSQPRSGSGIHQEQIGRPKSHGGQVAAAGVNAWTVLFSDGKRDRHVAFDGLPQGHDRSEANDSHDDLKLIEIRFTPQSN